MYSITNVIVGVPITSKMDRWVNDQGRDWEELGFETFYHGGADQSMGFCGVQLGVFDECAEYIRVNPDGTLHYVGYGKPKVINLIPTKEQVEEAQQKVNALNPAILELCPEFGVYFVQSTS